MRRRQVIALLAAATVAEPGGGCARLYDETSLHGLSYLTPWDFGG
jgi:hypothetical protein